MGRQVLVLIFCDPCAEEDTQTEGTPFTLSINGAKPRELVLCEQHEKQYLTDLMQMMPKLPTVEAIAATPVLNEGEQETCLICNKTLKNRPTLQGHVRNQHDMVWSDYKIQHLGEASRPGAFKNAAVEGLDLNDPDFVVPDEFKCQEAGCDKVYDPREYKAPAQALAVHRAKTHGIAGKNKAKQTAGR